MAKIPKIMRSYRFSEETISQVRFLSDELVKSDADAIAWAVSLAFDMLTYHEPDDLGVEPYIDQENPTITK